MMQSFIKGENLKLNGSVLLASIIVTAVWYQVNLAEPLAEGEVAPAWKSQGLYVLAAVTLLLSVPVVWGMVAPSTGSDFNTRIAEASSNLRESLEEASPASQDFETRVSEAASKLREQIGKSSATVVDYPTHDLEPTASSLAAQASAEIDRFIADNS